MSVAIDARLVKMVETFIPTIEFCGICVYFAGPDEFRIVMCSLGEGYGYCLYDSKPDVEYEYKFKTIEEVAQKAKEYLDKYEIVDFKVSGFSLLNA